jgi:hypothetical protein
MNPVGIEQSHDAVRRTALVLHALAPADREWVLGRLPERNRAQVVPCLEELATLGIPQDANLIPVALSVKRQEITRPPAQRGSRVERLAAVLEKEPAKVAAIALRSRTDAERDSILNALSPGQAQEVRDHLRAPHVVPAALRQALEEAIALQDAPPVDRSPRRASFAQRWQAGWVRISGVFL